MPTPTQSNQPTAPAHAVVWFDIPTTDLARAQAFYEAVLVCKLRPEPMGPSQGAIFPYSHESNGVGGALLCGPTAPPAGAQGPVIYLDASPSLDAALERALKLGASIASPRVELPRGMGAFAHIFDLDGNRVGLHAQA